MNEAAGIVVGPDAPLPRKRGRPKGLPKTGGRPPGRKNWSNPEIRDELLDRSDVLSVLADIVAGRALYVGPAGSVGKAGWRHPTLAQRMQAGEIILRKLLPDLKASELTGADGSPLIPTPESNPDTRQLSRAVIALLTEAHDDLDGELSQGVSSSDRKGTSDGGAALPGEWSTSSDAPPSPPEPQGPQVGERILVGDKGAQIIWTELSTGRPDHKPDPSQRRWEVLDGFGVSHGFRRIRAEAEELASRLPGPAEHAREGEPRS